MTTTERNDQVAIPNTVELYKAYRDIFTVLQVGEYIHDSAALSVATQMESAADIIGPIEPEVTPYSGLARLAIVRYADGLRSSVTESAKAEPKITIPAETIVKPVSLAYVYSGLTPFNAEWVASAAEAFGVGEQELIGWIQTAKRHQSTLNDRQATLTDTWKSNSGPRAAIRGLRRRIPLGTRVADVLTPFREAANYSY